MIPYIVYDPATGELVRTGYCPADYLAAQAMPGEGVIEGYGEYGGCHIQNGALVAYTPEQAAARAQRPDYPTTWSNTTMCWQDIRDFDALKLYKLAELKAARDDAIYGGFTWNSLRFDSDFESQSRLMGAALDGSGEVWRLSDNSWHFLSGDDLRAVWAAFKTHLRAQFATFGQLEDQAKAATDTTTLETITWPT